MARPRKYATEEERRAALRANWQKYNEAHRVERAAHNKTYCQREEIKQQRKELRVARTIAKRSAETNLTVSVESASVESAALKTN